SLGFGTAYSYRVVATNSGGEAAASNEATAVTDAAPVPPRIQLSASVLDFGDAAVGRKVKRRLTIENVGGAPLLVSVGSVEKPFRILSGGGRFRLGKGRKRVVVIQFSPTEPIPEFGELSIESTDPDLPSTFVTLTGEGE
ncbi:MAG: Abnormal spindle-like microcephaly-assocd, ASPM-SPD-2-Hydin, partial [Armatimonadetes bacterium]|nr:Abnormal spindle-like microcephaly-assocd, ASPM-SPD-2-Hydin [Armatimonadota bacterium]